MEEVFKRAEHQFKTLDEQIGWLSSFKTKPGNAYEKDAVRVAETLQRSIEISEQAKSSNSLSELKELLSEAKKLKFNKDKPLEIIDDRIISIEEVLEKERLETEAREEATEIARQGREIAERTAREAEEVERVERTLIEEASTMAFTDGKISKIVKTEEERRDLPLREKQILGRYMTQLR